MAGVIKCAASTHQVWCSPVCAMKKTPRFPNDPWDERYLYLHDWLVFFMVNVGKYTIHRSHMGSRWFSNSSVSFAGSISWALSYVGKNTWRFFDVPGSRSHCEGSNGTNKGWKNSGFPTKFTGSSSPFCLITHMLARLQIFPLTCIFPKILGRKPMEILSGKVKKKTVIVFSSFEEDNGSLEVTVIQTCWTNISNYPKVNSNMTPSPPPYHLAQITIKQSRKNTEFVGHFGCKIPIP